MGAGRAVGVSQFPDLARPQGRDLRGAAEGHDGSARVVYDLANFAIAAARRYRMRWRAW
jgi:hypothetical protein